MLFSAMQQKPVGDSRIPTDCWSGLYFSKSMPDQALYDKLSQNVFRFRSPAMSSTSEVQIKQFHLLLVLYCILLNNSS